MFIETLLRKTLQTKQEEQYIFIISKIHNQTKIME